MTIEPSLKINSEADISAISRLVERIRKSANPAADLISCLLGDDAQLTSHSWFRGAPPAP